MLNIDKYSKNYVNEYLKVLTKDDVDNINRWTSHADVDVKTLLNLHKKINHIEYVDSLHVYRGIGSNLSYQEKMNLFDKKFFMHFLKNGVKEGYKFNYNTPRPLSFTTDLSTARAFGNIIISSVFTKEIKYIKITESLSEACNKIDTSSLFNEVILLDINKDIEYKVFKKYIF